MLRTGSEEWWQPCEAAVPRSDGAIGNVLVADPAGMKLLSPSSGMAYITGVTDHHQNARPQSLQRLPGPTPGSAHYAVADRAAASVLFPPTVTMIFPQGVQR